MERPQFVQSLEVYRRVDLVSRSRYHFATPVSCLVVLGDFNAHSEKTRAVIEMNCGTRAGPSRNLWPWSGRRRTLRGAKAVLEFTRAHDPRMERFFPPGTKRETVIFEECVLLKELVSHTGHGAQKCRKRKADLHWTVGVCL